ncbi:MAG: hypothetical protein ACFBRM_15370 [Pikeienuella sp.]
MKSLSARHNPPIRIAWLVACLLVLAPADASAQGLNPGPAELPGETWGSPADVAAKIEALVPLVRSTRMVDVEWGDGAATVESDLRVSLLVLDLGPATDVSPRQEIHLALHNELTEFATAWALAPIAAVWRFEGAARRAPGIYEIAAEVLHAGSPGCFIRKATLTLDARALSIAVRQGNGLDFGETRRYRVAVDVTPQLGDCAR